MNKKILMSIAAAATIASTFTGCGGTDAVSSGSSNTGTTNSSGVTTIGGTTVGASKGALSGATVTISGTTVTATGGTDVISGTAFTGTVKSDTSLTDADGKVITNTFTNLAMESSDTNKTSALTKVATVLGTTPAALKKVFQATAEDAQLENTARLLQRQFEANPTAVKNAITANTTTTISGLLNAVNNVTNLVASAKLSDMLNNLTKNPTQFANTLKAYDANNSIDFNTTLASNAITYPGLSLDSNVSTTTITSGVADLSRINDSNLTSSQIADLNETASILVRVKNLASSSINSNASYAIKLAKLSPVTSGNYITNFVANSNSSLVVTANSNLSKGLTLNDGNITQVMTGITADSGSGIDINVTALTNYLTTLIGTGHDTATNGNFTSGMSATGTYGVKVLVNVNDHNFTTSDKAWLIGKDSINFGKDADTAAAGTSYPGFKVLDSNLTK